MKNLMRKRRLKFWIIVLILKIVILGSIYELNIYLKRSNQCVNSSIIKITKKVVYKEIDNALKLEDIMIVIKTTSRNHNTRIKYIASSWYQMAKDQV